MRSAMAALLNTPPLKSTAVGCAAVAASATAPVIVIAPSVASLSASESIVTVPVEFNASTRAKAAVLEYGLVTVSEERDISRMLSAAALTYVALVLFVVTVLVNAGARLLIWRVSRGRPSGGVGL